ncbi:tyrosine-type recombinase/integrase [Brevundimonas sp. TWP2-1]|uniref:tyrosine-type recombinase/integrase n=2 Tax=unclassified Brevundimonas TaxID=2622653 RepID=UPI003CEAD178
MSQGFMPRQAAELGALAVSRLDVPGYHAVGGVTGLYLQVLPAGGRTWILRAAIGGRRREMGLGGYPSVTLAGARDAARAARDLIRAGVDPITKSRAARAALVRKSDNAGWTFRKASETYVATHEAAWKNAKHRAQWSSSLEAYAYPVIGDLSVDRIGVPQILDILTPIWTTKTETAKRVRGRLEAVLDWATTRELRSGPNPARWKGHLDKLLADPGKVSRVRHHRALPIDEMPEFIARLSKVGGMGARALMFGILTAARSGETRGATWGEIDLGRGTWTLPAERMKGGRPHRVALSDAALSLLGVPGKPDDLVFPAANGGTLSDMTLTKVLRDMKVDAVPHGFRSTFRDWAAERTEHANELAEMALAHAVGSKVEAAYRRGDLFERRVVLMNDWAVFCGLGR